MMYVCLAAVQISAACALHLGPPSQCDDAGMFVGGVAAYRVPDASPIPAPLLERHLMKQDAKKRIAFALRGEGFRSGSLNSGFDLNQDAMTCGDHTYKVQFGIYKSHKINVIDPLEREGYAVDTYIFTKPCYNGNKFHQDLIRWYQPTGFTLLDNTTFAQKEQSGIYDPMWIEQNDPTMKLGVFWQSAFAEHLLESIKHSTYESILMVRLDQMFTDTPITDMIAHSGEDGVHFPQQGEIYGTENLVWFHSDDQANVHHKIRAGCVTRGFGDCENFGLNTLPLDGDNVQTYYDGSSIYWKCEMGSYGVESNYFDGKGFNGSLARLWMFRKSPTSCCNAYSTVLSFGKLIA